ncbi:hypothetical protein PF008_g3451 [Phytophthora fragariae]|uniref:Protein kinase domain-containing protein n=1 Tax=Phytophthora fragariae TaxID=53985 RepID=A0A6G0SG48_9STRA|nr:hypothetical protein PF008_g3451 [Phytophthora fragariae]
MVSMWRERTRNFGKVELMWRERTLISKIPPKLREIPLILLVSAARVSNISFRWRLRYLWVALGESEIETRQREARWEKWSSNQIEIFKSGVTDAYVVLNASELDDLDNCLYAEMEYFLWEYTPDEVKVLQMVHDDVKNKSDDLCNDLSGLKPDWFIPRHELVEIERYNPLGSGGFGRVFRAKWLNSDVVLKVLLGDCDEIDTSSSMSLCSMTQSRAPASSGDDTKQTESMKMFRREVDVWFGFNHPHVVQLFGACHIDIPFFVCEYAANGTLVGYLKKHPDELWSKLHEAALGVQYLHARNVVHGDLKGNNVVIGGDMKAKVTDFGLSLTSTDDGKPLISGAWHWVAPECLRGDNTRPTFASDVHSLGMGIIEALRVVEAVKSGKDFISCRPWRLCDINAVKYHVKQGKIPPRPEICDDNQWHLVERMCVLDPQKRIKISTVVDELERLASVPDLNRAEISTKPAFQALEVISAAQDLLARLQGDSKGVAKAYTEAVYSLYGSMWDRLEQVHRQIQVNIDFAGVTDFCSIIGDADKCTRRLEDTQSTSNLIYLMKTTMRCYAIGRRLDKFMDDYFLVADDQLQEQ